MDAQTLAGGFTAPPIQAAHAFRSVMEAMARPGMRFDIEGAEPPSPMSHAAGAVLLTLCDRDTPVYLAGAYDRDVVRKWLAFHTGAPIVGQSEAMFAIGAWDALVPLSSYPIGTSEYPDRSATLIVECDALCDGSTLTGPGIKETASLNLPDIAAFQSNHALFPLGLDFLFTSGNQLAALPRSTEVS